MSAKRKSSCCRCASRHSSRTPSTYSDQSLGAPQTSGRSRISCKCNFDNYHDCYDRTVDPVFPWTKPNIPLKPCRPICGKRYPRLEPRVRVVPTVYGDRKRECKKQRMCDEECRRRCQIREDIKNQEAYSKTIKYLRLEPRIFLPREVTPYQRCVELQNAKKVGCVKRWMNSFKTPCYSSDSDSSCGEEEDSKQKTKKSRCCCNLCGSCDELDRNGKYKCRFSEKDLVNKSSEACVPSLASLEAVPCPPCPADLSREELDRKCKQCRFAERTEGGRQTGEHSQRCCSVESIEATKYRQNSPDSSCEELDRKRKHKCRFLGTESCEEIREHETCSHRDVGKGERNMSKPHKPWSKKEKCNLSDESDEEIIEEQKSGHRDAGKGERNMSKPHKAWSKKEKFNLSDESDEEIIEEQKSGHRDAGKGERNMSKPYKPCCKREKFNRSDESVVEIREHEKSCHRDVGKGERNMSKPHKPYYKREKFNNSDDSMEQEQLNRDLLEESRSRSRHKYSTDSHHRREDSEERQGQGALELKAKTTCTCLLSDYRIVSAIQAFFSFLVGFIVCKSTCSKSFVYASHFLMEAYAWFGTAYFMYDIWAMYKVHTQKIADKLKLMSQTAKANGATKSHSNGANGGGYYDKHNSVVANGPSSAAAGDDLQHVRHHEDEICDYDGECVQVPKDGKWDFLRYVMTHPIMIIHHIFIGTFGLLVVSYIRGGGHCIYSYMFMMEFSTPFVSLRGILSTLDMKDTRAYVINGLTMLATFFLCRVLIWPYVMWRYSVAIDATFWQAMTGLPRGCLISILILFLPQIYWFFLMSKGAIKVLFPSKSKVLPTNKSQQQSKNNNRSPVTPINTEEFNSNKSRSSSQKEAIKSTDFVTSTREFAFDALKPPVCSSNGKN